MTSYEPGWLLFASDADRLLLVGCVSLLVAVLALVMDRRRQRRDRIIAADRVGCVPWTLVFVIGTILGLGLIAVSVASGP